MESYKEKIRKLLALADSPNENEAIAALLKARELMARYKLTEEDCRAKTSRSVKYIETKYTFSKRKESWMGNLSALIGEMYCCKAYRKHKKGKQTQTVGFIGLAEDVEMCANIFSYAVSCIREGIKDIEIEYARYRYFCDHAYIKAECESYGYGFIDGISEAREKQDKNQSDEWGLILQTPKEVEEEAAGLLKEAFIPAAQRNIHENAYFVGKRDGVEFDPSYKLFA